MLLQQKDNDSKQEIAYLQQLPIAREGRKKLKKSVTVSFHAKARQNNPQYMDLFIDIHGIPEEEIRRVKATLVGNEKDGGFDEGHVFMRDDQQHGKFLTVLPQALKNPQKLQTHQTASEIIGGYLCLDSYAIILTELEKMGYAIKVDSGSLNQVIKCGKTCAQAADLELYGDKVPPWFCLIVSGNEALWQLPDLLFCIKHHAGKIQRQSFRKQDIPIMFQLRIAPESTPKPFDEGQKTYQTEMQAFDSANNIHPEIIGTDLYTYYLYILVGLFLTALAIGLSILISFAAQIYLSVELVIALTAICATFFTCVASALFIIGSTFKNDLATLDEELKKHVVLKDNEKLDNEVKKSDRFLDQLFHRPEDYINAALCKELLSLISLQLSVLILTGNQHRPPIAIGIAQLWEKLNRQAQLFLQKKISGEQNDNGRIRKFLQTVYNADIVGLSPRWTIEPKDAQSILQYRRSWWGLPGTASWKNVGGIVMSFFSTPTRSTAIQSPRHSAVGDSRPSSSSSASS